MVIRLPEDAADALKHVGVFTLYKILLIYILCRAVVHLLVWIINNIAYILRTVQQIR